MRRLGRHRFHARKSPIVTPHVPIEDSLLVGPATSPRQPQHRGATASAGVTKLHRLYELKCGQQTTLVLGELVRAIGTFTCLLNVAERSRKEPFQSYYFVKVVLYLQNNFERFFFQNSSQFHLLFSIYFTPSLLFRSRFSCCCFHCVLSVCL